MFIRSSLLAIVRLLVFSFSFIFGQGPIHDYFYRRLALIFKPSQLLNRLSKSSETNAKNFVEPLFPANQLEHGFDKLKFGCKQI